MKGFYLYLLAGKNPANALSEIARLRLEGREALSALCRQATAWRVEVVARAYDACVSSKELTRWALVESLNTGSYQRISCPIELKGSGRWEANDKGGRYSLLLDAVLTWQKMPEARRELFRLTAEEFSLFPPYYSGDFAQFLFQELSASERRLKINKAWLEVQAEYPGSLTGYEVPELDEYPEFWDSVDRLLKLITVWT